jgi:hypothetical protein
MTLQGTGNLHNIDFPKINLPKGLTLYGDPKQSEKYTFTTNGAEGKIDLEYTIQVNKEGSFNIPPIEVSYFDVKAKKYVTIKSDEIILDGDEVKLSSTNPKGKTTVIAEKQTNLSESKDKESDSLFNSPFVWVSLSSLILIAGFVGISARTKKSSTIAFDKSISEEVTLTFNWKDVENHLKHAELALQQNDSNKLISALENAILIGIRVATNESSLSKNASELLNRLKSKMPDDGITNQLKGILEKCQNARYGWGLSQNELDTLIPDVRKILGNLKNEILFL